MFWGKAKHFFCRNECFKNIVWNDTEIPNTVKCGGCGKTLAIYYVMHDKLYFLAFPMYEKSAVKIRRLVEEHIKERKNLGDDSESEWNNLHNHVKNICGSINVSPVEETRGGMDKGWEGCESDETRRISLEMTEELID